MGDMVADHVAMCRKINEELARIDDESGDEEADDKPVAKKKSDITR